MHMDLLNNHLLSNVRRPTWVGGGVGGVGVGLLFNGRKGRKTKHITSKRGHGGQDILLPGRNPHSACKRS